MITGKYETVNMNLSASVFQEQILQKCGSNNKAEQYNLLGGIQEAGNSLQSGVITITKWSNYYKERQYTFTGRCSEKELFLKIICLKVTRYNDGHISRKLSMSSGWRSYLEKISFKEFFKKISRKTISKKQF